MKLRVERHEFIALQIRFDGSGPQRGDAHLRARHHLVQLCWGRLKRYREIRQGEVVEREFGIDRRGLDDILAVPPESVTRYSGAVTTTTGRSVFRRIDWVTLPKSAFPTGDRARPPTTRYRASTSSAYSTTFFPGFPTRPMTS